MKTKEELVQMLRVTLDELMSGCVDSNPGLKTLLKIRLEVLCEILGDEVPEDCWEKVEEFT